MTGTQYNDLVQVIPQFRGELVVTKLELGNDKLFTPPTTERLLVQQCLKGNTKAFEILVDKYQKPIYNIAYRMIKNHEQAEDVAQYAFIKAFENLKSFNFKSNFFSWLYRIAVNESFNRINQKKKFEELDASLLSPESTPNEAFQERELCDIIQDSLMEISLDYRVLIVLKHFHNCSYEEIAYILDIPERKVKSGLFTARKLLKAILINNGLVAYD